MGRLETLPRIRGQIRAGLRTRPLAIRQSDTAIIFTLRNGAIEVDLTSSAEGGLVLPSHQAGLAVQLDGAIVVVPAMTATE